MPPVGVIPRPRRLHATRAAAVENVPNLSRKAVGLCGRRHAGNLYGKKRHERRDRPGGVSSARADFMERPDHNYFSSSDFFSKPSLWNTVWQSSQLLLSFLTSFSVALASKA